MGIYENTRVHTFPLTSTAGISSLLLAEIGIPGYVFLFCLVHLKSTAITDTIIIFSHCSPSTIMVSYHSPSSSLTTFNILQPSLLNTWGRHRWCQACRKIGRWPEQLLKELLRICRSAHQRSPNFKVHQGTKFKAPQVQLGG